MPELHGSAKRKNKRKEGKAALRTFDGPEFNRPPSEHRRRKGGAGDDVPSSFKRMMSAIANQGKKRQRSSEDTGLPRASEVRRGFVAALRHRRVLPALSPSH